jgi:hypothetical protein
MGNSRNRLLYGLVFTNAKHDHMAYEGQPNITFELLTVHSSRKDNQNSLDRWVHLLLPLSFLTIGRPCFQSMAKRPQGADSAIDHVAQWRSTVEDPIPARRLYPFIGLS